MGALANCIDPADNDQYCPSDATVDLQCGCVEVP